MFIKKIFIITILFSIVLWFGSTFIFPVLAEEGGDTLLEAILGCTDETASNYNPEATEDDGSCTYSEQPADIEGCTDTEALNYNSEATIDNGSCEYPVEGCMDSGALNYNPDATVDNGSCEYPVEGCMDPEATNYNSEATVDNGSCEYVKETGSGAEAVLGCMDQTAENYNPDATEDDGSCTYPELDSIPGCTDSTANNYNPDATQDDGSCQYPPAEINGCTDPAAYNYNPDATSDDGSCRYPVVPVKPGQNFDPATAPSKVTIRVFMPDGTSPPFPVFVTFVGVGNKNFGGKIDANGELTVTMPSGRYYTELMIINTEYIQGEDGPSFFLEANEGRDFGAIRLISKSEQNKRGQSLEDQTLEANILSEVGDSKGMGKILLLILKLLMKILEEVRAIASQLVGR